MNQIILSHFRKETFKTFFSVCSEESLAPELFFIDNKKGGDDDLTVSDIWFYRPSNHFWGYQFEIDNKFEGYSLTLDYEETRKNSEGYYKNGKKEGHWIDYGEDGKKESEGPFVNGEEEGLWTFYYGNGTETQVDYKGGKCSLLLVENPSAKISRVEIENGRLLYTIDGDSLSDDY